MGPIEKKKAGLVRFLYIAPRCLGGFCNVRCRPGSPCMDACSLGNMPSVADLDTELLTRLSAWQSAVSSLSPRYTDELGWLYVVYAAGPQLLGQGFPSACQMSLLIGRARAGNLRRHDRSGDGTLRRSSLSRTSLPARTRQAE